MKQKVFRQGFKRSPILDGFPSCKILGVDIIATRKEVFEKQILSHVNDLKGDYICVTCVHNIVMAYEDDGYLECQNGGVASIPDGGSLSSISKKRGYQDAERITGPDLMTSFFEKTKQFGLKHFFYGSTKETLQKLGNELRNKYPEIEIVGMYSPPFRPVTEEEDARIIEMINSTGANVIWVGLGAPKQEIWMANHQGRVNGLMIGVGAGFDYHAGNEERAPQWMQKIHMEWFYRMVRNPKRLAKRYLHSVPILFWNGYIMGK